MGVRALSRLIFANPVKANWGRTNWPKEHWWCARSGLERLPTAAARRRVHVCASERLAAQ